MGATYVGKPTVRTYDVHVHNNIGKPTEEAVFETDQHGRPTALAGVAATAREALTEANRRRSRALKGLEDAFNRSLRRSQNSGLGKNCQVRWRRRDPYAVPG